MSDLESGRIEQPVRTNCWKYIGLIVSIAWIASIPLLLSTNRMTDDPKTETILFAVFIVIFSLPFFIVGVVLIVYALVKLVTCLTSFCEESGE